MLRLPLVIAIFCAAISPAAAAPTCQDANGSVARCGTPGAMPLGWKPSDAEYHRRQAALGNVFDPKEVVNAVALIVGLFAIIALLPAFDGRSDADWDKQEGDDRRRR